MNGPRSNEVQHGHASHVGRVREHNEDTYLADPDIGLWVVADGMGGHDCGEVASQIVVSFIRDSVQQGLPISEAVQKAHLAVLMAAEAGQGRPGMGSTVVAARLNGSRYEVAWVGDSRAYLWDKDKLEPLTRDHSYIQEMIDAGTLTERDAQWHPYRNLVTQAIGAVDIAEVNVDTVDGRFDLGQQLLLCSDGLTGELSGEEIAAVLREPIDEQAKVDRLIQQALAHGGSDNITVVLISAPGSALGKPGQSSSVAESDSSA